MGTTTKKFDEDGRWHIENDPKGIELLKLLSADYLQGGMENIFDTLKKIVDYVAEYGEHE